ncbi:MAG: U32 family peptidase [candidate division NC10 bacterium]|nr:U32 family peptidase [candidate division NC10 bacterium]
MAKLLAPGGTLEMAYAVLEEGAEAVYVGAFGWSRRSYQLDLKDEEIKELNGFARTLQREVKVAINAMPGPTEMRLLLKKAEQYMDWGVSGLLMSDPGCIVEVRRHFPTLGIHTSVGCGLTNREDIRFYKDLGANFVILPYRLTPEEVKAIKEELEVGLEVFLFQPLQGGLVCPGKCIMSSFLVYKEWSDETEDGFIGSANRGARGCSRVCQAGWEFTLPHEDTSKKTTLRSDPAFMLWEVPGYIKAGVEYLKIQGRERSLDLVRDLVRFYRGLVDEVEASPEEISLERHVAPWQELRRRWTMERSRRAGLLLSQAAVGGRR